MSEFTEKLLEGFRSFLLDTNKQEEVKVYKEDEQLVPQAEDDGSVVITSGGMYGTYIDLDNRIKSDEEYISLVRNLSIEPEFDYAISEIINELFVIDENENPVKIDLEQTELPDTVKSKIIKEFKNILMLLNFSARGYDISRQWYVDGKLYYHKIIDEKNPRQGIVELRNIDPRRIKKIKEVEREKNKDGVEIIKSQKDFFIFNSFGKDSISGIKIHPDNICYITSGIKNPQTGAIVSHLYKAIKRYNQLRLLEESVIIYRFSRAPERRVFYIDVGNMPPKKGEKYIEDLIRRHRNKAVYDASSGTMSETKKYTSLLEDYWFARTGSGSGTKIETLGGSQLSNGMEDVNEFRKQFYLSLNVPLSRLEPETGFSLGRASEISREEVKFARFCTRLRVRFSDLFDDLLQTQLILKNIISYEDWIKIKQKIKYRYNVDTHFRELLNQEVLQSRLRVVQDIIEFTPLGSKYPLFSLEWVKKHLLLQTEDEIQSIKEKCRIEFEEIARAGIVHPDDVAVQQHQAELQQNKVQEKQQ